MFGFDFPILVQPAKPGFIVRICGLNGRPLDHELPIICTDLDEVINVLRERLTPPQA